ncbi:MAG: hypothetical protein II776_01800 [Clostridia bacterium]|nr:hypothetical protein [Clostridia bacterium]
MKATNTGDPGEIWLEENRGLIIDSLAGVDARSLLVSFHTRDVLKALVGRSVFYGGAV